MGGISEGFPEVGCYYVDLSPMLTWGRFFKARLPRKTSANQFPCSSRSMLLNFLDMAGNFFAHMALKGWQPRRIP